MFQSLEIRGAWLVVSAGAGEPTLRSAHHGPWAPGWGAITEWPAARS